VYTFSFGIDKPPGVLDFLGVGVFVGFGFGVGVANAEGGSGEPYPSALIDH
jgi:hypothetical protein